MFEIKSRKNFHVEKENKKRKGELSVNGNQAITTKGGRKIRKTPKLRDYEQEIKSTDASEKMHYRLDSTQSPKSTNSAGNKVATRDILEIDICSIEEIPLAKTEPEENLSETVINFFEDQDKSKSHCQTDAEYWREKYLQSEAEKKKIYEKVVILQNQLNLNKYLAKKFLENFK